ncbi:iron-containing alcohol dehydrogenase [Aestuariivirga sp.]|uniref:iron-containing alcohol dehydrogenase n=1 Tax=Aestuariivirga sp. TaxID=2650926 RepID=UPI0025C3E3AA|nr:iron-containing alcohol dehydrogenase [Aestuariivirga sp.]MCA3556174.1 iron-containing alcohol dehydrogenase [Aestuariivirga sp.]
MTDWNELISDVVAGRWQDPATGKTATVPFEVIRIEEDLDGGEADVLAPLNLGRRIAVVSDVNTHEAMGRRVARRLKSLGAVEELVLPGDTHCDEPTIAMVREKTRHADALVAVGSGALSDTCKFATFKDGRKYATFGTAASMNGYAASTASVTLANGYKTSLPAHAPRGIFLDLKVSAAAPHWLSAAGLGDSLCRPTAQVEWWASHRLFGTFYSGVPYTLTGGDEPRMIDNAAGLKTHDIAANGHLHRVLTLCGLGVCFTGVSHHGSMGEHQVSHWIDMFAGGKHPGSTHGQQVGVASLAIARLHHELLALDQPPLIRATHIEEKEFVARYGEAIGRMCHAEARKKSFDRAGAEAFNRKLAAMWPQLRGELRPMLMDPAKMKAALAAAGGPTTATELGLDRQVWRDAMKFARDVRNRWSFLDLADDAGLLDDFLARDEQ